jgi:hypothetical protein
MANKYSDQGKCWGLLAAVEILLDKRFHFLHVFYSFLLLYLCLSDCLEDLNFQYNIDTVTVSLSENARKNIGLHIKGYAKRVASMQ